MDMTARYIKFPHVDGLSIQPNIIIIKIHYLAITMKIQSPSLFCMLPCDTITEIRK